MALSLHPSQERHAPLAQVFAIDSTLLERPEAQQARREGVLLAKREALSSATALLRWGRVLSWIIVFVSAIHIWETVATIAPQTLATLHLPAAVYHGAALAFTLMIDACALFVSRANAVAAFVPGAPANRWGSYFYGVTALLNASFIATHAPTLDPHIQTQLLPLFSAAFIILLPLSVPIGIVAVEASLRTLEACRLTLLIEVTTLGGIDTSMPSSEDTSGHGRATPAAGAHDPARQPTAAGHIAAIARSYRCKYCDATNLTVAEMMTHGRLHARYGSCLGREANTHAQPAMGD